MKTVQFSEGQLLWWHRCAMGDHYVVPAVFVRYASQRMAWVYRETDPTQELRRVPTRVLDSRAAIARAEGGTGE